MILTELMQKSKFFRSSIFANIIIIFGMIPQFLVVPLIISYWGEVEYSKYVAFIAIVNIFAQINAAMQNGYILKLIPEEKFSANELSSMFILNVIMSVFMIIGIFLWSKYFSSNYEFSYLGYIICTVLLIFFIEFNENNNANWNFSTISTHNFSPSFLRNYCAIRMHCIFFN